MLQQQYTPSLPEYQNEIGVAYWQWATANYTMSFLSYGSWSDVYPELFSGRYEISAFKADYFMLQISPANQAVFSSVNLYNNVNQPGTNFENLFQYYDVNAGLTSPPPANSLFNITNMQTLVALGESTPNILENYTETFNSTFTLQSGWYDLTTTLNLTEV
jgi:hypothetical protein